MPEVHGNGFEAQAELQSGPPVTMDPGSIEVGVELAVRGQAPSVDPLLLGGQLFAVAGAAQVGEEQLEQAGVADLGGVLVTTAAGAWPGRCASTWWS